MPSRRVKLGLAQTALLFAALGDETRLALLRQLSAAGPASITRLAENFQVTRQAITKHLQFLAAAGVVEGTRAGRSTIGRSSRPDWPRRNVNWTSLREAGMTPWPA